jgi:tetratricopeptide (TPR) repeat protein
MTSVLTQFLSWNKCLIGIKEIRMDSQFYLNQIEKLDNPEHNKLKIKRLIEKAILESNYDSDNYWIIEAIKKYLNDLDWIRGLLESKESKTNPEHYDVALDYVILGDTIAENLNDCAWALSCYEQSEIHIQSLWDYYSLIFSLHENFPENPSLDLLEKAYLHIEKEDPCSSEISAMASLTLEITGDQKKAIELYQKALDIDENDGICWDDRIAICQSIATDLEDHKWAKIVIQQLKIDINCPKTRLTDFQTLSLQNYLVQSLDSSIMIVPSFTELRDYYDEIIYCDEVCVVGVVSGLVLYEDDGHKSGHILLDDDTASLKVFVVPEVLSNFDKRPKFDDILSVKGTLDVHSGLVVIKANSIQLVDSNPSK